VSRRPTRVAMARRSLRGTTRRFGCGFALHRSSFVRSYRSVRRAGAVLSLRRTHFVEICEAFVAVDVFAGVRMSTEPREHSSDGVAAPAALVVAFHVVALKRWNRAARAVNLSAVSTCKVACVLSPHEPSRVSIRIHVVFLLADFLPARDAKFAPAFDVVTLQRTKLAATLRRTFSAFKINQVVNITFPNF